MVSGSTAFGMCPEKLITRVVPAYRALSPAAAGFPGLSDTYTKPMPTPPMLDMKGSATASAAAVDTAASIALPPRSKVHNPASVEC